MQDLIEACKLVFSCVPHACGIARLHVSDDGTPVDFEYAYANDALNKMTAAPVDDLTGMRSTDLWTGLQARWLEPFMKAAYGGESAEFEAVAVDVRRFLHVAAFPLGPGMCGFVMQDVTDWFGQAYFSLDNTAAGLFFYDPLTSMMTLTPAACEYCGLDDAYLILSDFMEQLFDAEEVRDFTKKMREMRPGIGTAGTIAFEGQLADGRWLRLGLAMPEEAGRFAVGLLEDVTEQKRLKEADEKQRAALQDALDLAQHASEAKSTFLTNMSHDFRTPLNAITGFAQIARRHVDDADRVRDCMDKIMVSGNHLLGLVDDILDVSRVESGKMPIVEEPCDLREQLESMNTMFSTHALEKGIRFRVTEEGLVHPQVMVDRLRLNQILVNVAGNAFKFTPEGGEVSVLLSESPHRTKGYGSYTFAVTDTGCGMKPEFIEKLFMPFERDGLGRPNTTEGTGLGMTIVKNLVELMGGTIEVHSREGEGTTIAITLSLKAQKNQPAVTDSKHKGVAYGTVNFAGKRVLVVDDDDLSREIARELLCEHGFEVEEAEDGDVAVARMNEVAEGYYDAIIMDMRMGAMDGDEATRQIRGLARRDVEALPIIAVTADAFDEARHRSHEAGMTAHTTKPLNIPELLGILAEQIK